MTFSHTAHHFLRICVKVPGTAKYRTGLQLANSIGSTGIELIHSYLDPFWRWLPLLLSKRDNFRCLSFRRWSLCFMSLLLILCHILCIHFLTLWARRARIFFRIWKTICLYVKKKNTFLCTVPQKLQFKAYIQHKVPFQPLTQYSFANTLMVKQS